VPSTRRTGATLALTWVLLATTVAGLGYLITHPWQHPVNGFDNPISRWFAGERTPGLTDVADIGTYPGETVVGVVLIVLLAAFFAIWRRTWRPLVFAALVEAGIGGFYWVGTTLDPRLRPPVRILDSGLVPDASFPSGHVGTATAVAGCAIALTWAYARAARWWVAGLVVVPAFTLLSRLYLGAHHLTDTLTSLAYASAWVLAVALMVLPLRDLRDSPIP
jgi:membrane-associated phospholipid phosphatase